MKKILSNLVLCFVLLTSWAQTTELDSLRAALNTNRSLSSREKSSILTQIAESSLRISPEQAVDYGKQAISLMQNNNDNAGIAGMAKVVGKAFYLQSDFANALEYFSLALKKNLETNNQSELAASYNNIGVVYNRMGYYELALKNHLEQLRMNENTGDLRGISISNSNIGNIYNNMKENERAFEHYLRAKQISEQLGDSVAVAKSLINLGVVSMELEDFQQAINYFREALPVTINAEDQINTSVIYTNLGIAYRSLNEYARAGSFFEKSLQVSGSINNKQGMAIAMTNLGMLSLKLEDYKKSKNYLDNALDIAVQIDAKQLIRDIYKYLSQLNEKQGYFRAALADYKEMTRMGDSIMNAEKSRQIRNLQIVYEVSKKEKEILEQRFSIQKLKTNQFYLLLVIVIILSLAFVVYYGYRTKKRLNLVLEDKIAEALKQQKEQQQIIVHQASLTSLGELASGIAHEIKQPLQNISLSNESMQLEASESSPDISFIAESTRNIFEDVKRIRFIINEISNFSRGQQEQINEWFNMNTRIKNAFSLAQTKFARLNIRIDFMLDEKLPDIEGNPYKFEQIIVNFLNNARDAIEEKAAKSTKAFEKRIVVRSYADDNQLVVEVKDNGTGIPEDIKTNIFLPFYTTKPLGRGTGLGLSISLGIAKEMGGFIHIESKEMKGTTMQLVIPSAKH